MALQAGEGRLSRADLNLKVTAVATGIHEKGKAGQRAQDQQGIVVRGVEYE